MKAAGAQWSKFKNSSTKNTTLVHILFIEKSTVFLNYGALGRGGSRNVYVPGGLIIRVRAGPHLKTTRMFNVLSKRSPIGTIQEPQLHAVMNQGDLRNQVVIADGFIGR